MFLRINNKGFTIVEMLVSVFIIALLTAIFLANYRSGGGNLELKNAAQKMASDIRLAQSYSLNGKRFLNSSDWGVYFNKPGNAYSLFADTCSPKPCTPGWSAGENYLTIPLPANIEISQISSGNTATVVFIPPDPDILINGSASEATITLRNKKTSNTLIVHFNKLGLIEVE
ncbi:MAG: prepilin-type N-terminal cleavage/methylation domain-containing protein [Patescibacteria group bacterium]|jgi:prepilin-type N-terminal cleavage/methylation domain-containing protein